MKNIFIRATIVLAMISSALAAELDTGRIDQLTGLKGKFNEKERVYKITFPRDDVKVVVDDWTMPPFMGLGTWAAFTSTKDGAMVMGDTVLFEDEVNAAMSAALDNGLSVTALHNHFFFDLPETNSISPERLNKIFGTQGEAKDGMVKFTFGRPATMDGTNIAKEMGVNTWAAFAGTDDNAVVDGDFAVTEDELKAVLKSLVKQKIYIVAIHQHMTHEQPRMIFFHYWGRGRANDLAEMVKGAFFIAGLQEVSSPK